MPNVLARAPGNDTFVAAAWEAEHLTGSGRMAVLMDVNWLHPSYRGPQAHDLVQNLALFLSGRSEPPGEPVASMQANASSTEDDAPQPESMAGSGTAAP